MSALNQPVVEDADEIEGASHGSIGGQKARIVRSDSRQLRRAAYHEAGHAVACIARRIDFDWVAVRPLLPHLEWLDERGYFDPTYLGVVHLGEDHSDRDAGSVWLDRLLLMLAGPAAAARHTGARRISIFGTDREMAEFYAQASGQCDPAQVLRDGLTLARHLVDERWREIDAVAVALIESRFMGERRVRLIVANARRGRRPGGS